MPCPTKIGHAGARIPHALRTASNSLVLTHPSGESFNLNGSRPTWNTAPTTSTRPDRTESIQPTPSNGAFWQALELAGIWSWQPRYLNPGEGEGVQWQIAVRVGDRGLRSYGDNAFPASAGETDISGLQPRREVLARSTHRRAALG
jgi:hypothetical protein